MNTLANPLGEITSTSWTPSTGLSFDEWENVGYTFQAIDASINWWIGDWLNYGESRYGETYTQALEITGYRLQRLMNAKWVANKIHPSTRVDPSILSWSAHRQVAGLPPAEQAEWLQRAATEDWDSRTLRLALKETVSAPPVRPTEARSAGVEGALGSFTVYPGLEPSSFVETPENEVRQVILDGLDLMTIDQAVRWDSARRWLDRQEKTHGPHSLQQPEG